MNKELSKVRSEEVSSATPSGEQQWSTYQNADTTNERTPGTESSGTSRRKSAGPSKAKSPAKKSGN
jgi:hypothetical protein